MAVDRTFIKRWSAAYPADYDKELRTTVGPRVRARGAYDRTDLLAVGDWKSPRAHGRLDSNSDELIHDVTVTALAAPETIKHRVLTLLAGVRIPIASALLTAWNPDEFTVLDVRALASLRATGELDTTETPGYISYLQLCRGIARRCTCDLRTLDRALWASSGLLTM